MQLKKFRIITLFLLIFSVFNVFAYKSIDVAFTHDLHSHVEPFKYRLNDNDANATVVGGITRISSLIHDLRSNYPNMLLVDAGDFSMGTLYQSLFETDASELTLLSYLRYDATTFGNHEFDFGDDSITNMYNTLIKKRGDEYKVPLVKIANADYTKSSLNSLNLDDYVVVDKGGVRVAIFALMGLDAQRYTPETDLEFLPMIKSADAMVKRIKSEVNPDLIVCLSHTGTSENKKESEDELLAANVDGIDLIISGHTHTSLKEPIVVNNTVIASAGSYGVYLGTLRLEKDDNDDSWKLVTYKLHPITNALREDEALQPMIREWKEKINNTYLNAFNVKSDDVIMRSPINFASEKDTWNYKVKETNLSNFLVDSLLYMYNNNTKEDKAQIAVLPVGLIRRTFYKGDITVNDIFSINSLGNGPDGRAGYPVCTLYIKGNEVVSAVEVAVSLSKYMSSANLQFSGLRFKANKNRMILNKVYDVEIFEDGVWNKVDEDKYYKVVTDLYSLRMIGTVSSLSKGLIKLTPCDKDKNPIINFDNSIVYLENGAEMKAWTAPIYLAKTFSKGSGDIPLINERFYAPDGRRDIHSNIRPSELFVSWNMFSVILLILIIVVIVIVVVIIILIVKIKKKIRRRRERKRLKKANELIEDKRKR